MTKKPDHTTLLLAGGVAVVAVLAVATLWRPRGAVGGEPTSAPGSFWDKVANFTVHNGLATNGYGSFYNQYVLGQDPNANPLPPSGGLYGPSISDQYSDLWNPPSAPSTSSPSTPSSGFTPAGSSSSGSGFGVHYGGTP